MFDKIHFRVSAKRESKNFQVYRESRVTDNRVSKNTGISLSPESSLMNAL